jgi:hypothetical protein
LDYFHDGSTRKYWVQDVLDEINQGPASFPQLPPDRMIRVIQELMERMDFEKAGLDRDAALEDLNEILLRDGIEAYFDTSGICHVRNIDTETTSIVTTIQSRPLSPSELSRRKEIENFLDTASEDDFIDQFLVPLFRHLGFLRVNATGHRDRSLEYGKDLWMKYRLPTGHLIYFGAQVKKTKINAAGRELTKNISGILSQVQMALDDPIFDPETNRKNLLDHVFIISADLITKQAKRLLAEQLDKEARRHIIFMDREELLDLGAMTAVDLPGESDEEEIPF